MGVRNHVIILPVDDLSNAAAEAVAHNIKGTMAIPHPYGRLQFGADLELHFRTLIGTGCNPNVAAVVVIGIEDGWTQKVVDGIAATGKPVVGFGIEATATTTPSCALGCCRANTCSGQREAARGMPDPRTLDLDQMRRVRHHVRLRRQPHGRQRLRQAASAGQRRCCSARRPSSPAAKIVAARCRTTRRCASEFMFMFDRYQAMINGTRPATCRTRSPPRATSPAA